MHGILEHVIIVRVPLLYRYVVLGTLHQRRDIRSLWDFSELIKMYE